jgi:hypothetical protein
MSTSISFIPQECDLSLYQGAPVLLVCSCVDSTNTPINMTGGSILATIRAGQSRTSTLIATFTVTWVAQSTGQFNLSLASSVTDAFSFSGNAYWDIFYQDANTPANDYPLVWGIVTMQSDVSY